MSKLRIMVAIFGLLLGLSGAAHAALTQYDISGTVLSTSAGTTGSGIFTAKVIADPALSNNSVSSIYLNYGGYIIRDFDSAQLSSLNIIKSFSVDNNLNYFTLIYSNLGSTSESIAITAVANSGVSAFSEFKSNIGGANAFASISNITATPVSHTPIPAAAWLLGSGLLGMLGLKRRQNEA